MEREGAFLLHVEGATDKARVDEFRTHNLALKRQIEDLTKRYEGIDAENVKVLLEEKRRLEEAKHLKEGEVDKLVESRTRTLKSDLEKHIASLSTERDALNARLVEIEIIWTSGPRAWSARPRIFSNPMPAAVPSATAPVELCARTRSGKVPTGISRNCLKGIFASASMAGNLLAIQSESTAG